jgi:hypothetical protein
MTTPALDAGPLLLDSVLLAFFFMRWAGDAFAAHPGTVHRAARELALFRVHSPEWLAVRPGLLPAFVVPGRVEVATVGAAAESRARSAVRSCGAG